ncbi:hypothetical protein EVAR_8062_1 [Eumeta japonica]|uniref:Uncharacterized protein n=1 Tax=Eumeta variegata TaxID=151549 RepID=A0A4C1TH96_EUMVA|nr:hypothetical protein EVAR_8062_1 [Eumeta japonica]
MGISSWRLSSKSDLEGKANLVEAPQIIRRCEAQFAIPQVGFDLGFVSGAVPDFNFGPHPNSVSDVNLVSGMRYKEGRIIFKAISAERRDPGGRNTGLADVSRLANNPTYSYPCSKTRTGARDVHLMACR